MTELSRCGFWQLLVDSVAGVLHALTPALSQRVPCCSVTVLAAAAAALQVLATQQSLLTAGGCLLRSKGFVWLASCPGRVVEGSSSGLLLEVCRAHPWFCTLNEVTGLPSIRGGLLAGGVLSRGTAVGMRVRVAPQPQLQL
jgi:hypothetical protein